MSDGLTVLLWFMPTAVIIGLPFFLYYRYKKREEEENRKRLYEEQELKKHIELEKERKRQEAIEEHHKKMAAWREAEVKATARKQEQFENELDSIPKYDIKLSDAQLKKNNVADMDEITISKPRNGMKLSSLGDFVVIDTETTGLKVTSEIIELSAIKYSNFKPVSAFTTLIKPKKEISPEATAVNNITNDMVADAPTINQILPSFIEFVGNSNLLGQNLKFDLRFLYKNGFDFQGQKRKYYDTLEIAKSKLKRYRDDNHDYDVYDYKLETLCDFYGIKIKDAHRSLSDCYATAKLFINLLDEYELREDD